MTAEHVQIQNYACPHCRAVFRTAFQRCPLDGHVLEELFGDPLAGSSFADRYVIEECVGEGGMGRVYRARHQRMSRRFAVKVLFGDHAADSKMRQRLAREAEAASRLSHPNVISVVDFGETDEGLLYLVMDYVDGPTLAQVVEREAPLARDRVIRIARDCARGLAHAHSKGLIHRDFKADNVLITEDSNEEVAKIVDFGIAMLNEPSKSRKLTTEGMVLGTPAVMAPEQAVGEKVDHRTDLFSLGIVMYEMMAGVLPFDGTPLEIARQNLASVVPKVSSRVPGLWVDPELEALSMSLMSKRPEDRPQRAKDVLKALSRIEGESSREFRRSEAHLLESDPLTPVPGRDPSPSWTEDSPTEITPYPRPPAAPQPINPQQSAPHTAAAAGLTELVSAQRADKPGISRGGLIGIGAALLLVVMVAVLASSNDSETANNTDDTANGVDSKPGAPVDAAADFVDPGEILDEADAAAASVPVATPDARPPDPDPGKQTDEQSEADRRKQAERRKKLREERRRKELERKREAEERERKRREAEAAAKANSDEVTQQQFTARFRQVGGLLNKLSKADPGAAAQLRNQYNIIVSQYTLALRGPKVRVQHYKTLGAIRARAKRALKQK